MNKNQKTKHQIPKTQKGITLVALVITIIVLLILAVVAIRAIQNDSIINYAKNSVDEYERAQTNEKSLLQGYIDRIETELKIVPEDFEKYVLGAEKKGRSLMEILAFDEETGMPSNFINDETTMVDASKKVTYLNLAVNENSTKGYIYAKYNNKAYRIVMDLTYITESVQLIYEPKGREGTAVKYDSNGDGTEEDWTIITDRDGKVEIVSNSTMGSLALGYSVSSVYVTTDLDGNGTIGNDEDKAIASYNNAITRINDYCKEIVTSEEDSKIRSVGAGTDISGNYSSTNFDTWSGGKITAKAGDTYYEQDLVKMCYFGIVGPGTDYWLASRYVYEDSSDVTFRVSSVDADGTYYSTSLWNVDSGGKVGNYGTSILRVRPVVINPSGI